MTERKKNDKKKNKTSKSSRAISNFSTFINRALSKRESEDRAEETFEGIMVRSIPKVNNNNHKFNKPRDPQIE